LIMFRVKEFTDGLESFPTNLLYFEFVKEGDTPVLFNRDGSLMACFYYAGPDMDSSLGSEESELTRQMSSIFQGFGNGWSVHVDMIRKTAVEYPKENYFDNATSLLIESKRRADYQKEGEHFENYYAISFCYLPSIADSSNMDSLFVKKAVSSEEKDLKFIIEIFNRKLLEFEGNVSNKIHIKRMSSGEMMTFLNRCITGGPEQLPVPNPPVYLNHYLGAHEFVGGHEPMVDDRHVGVVTLTQFPYESYAGILNVLNNLPFEYRFSSRFLFYDPIDALGVVNEYQGKYVNMKHSIGQIIMGAFGKDIKNDPDAANRSILTRIEETKQVQQDIEMGDINYGYATFVVVVFDKDKSECKRKMEFIRDLLNNNWFPSIIERMNAVEAYLGSLPGETLKNIRKPFISTLNLSNMLILTDVWTGFQVNPCPYYPKNSPPLFYAATEGTTPFRFNVHVGDVGHSLVLGPTGAGKSVFLSHLANSALRYKDSQIFIFDKGYSQFAMTHALGGQFHDIMGETDSLSFCPFEDLSEPSEQKWACDWIERVLILQGMNVTSAIRTTIEEGIRNTAARPNKSLSKFYLNLQNDEIKEALKQFVSITDGYMASLLDAEIDGFKKSRFQAFEISSLMGLSNRLSTPVLLYLFHKIQRALDGRPTYIIIDEGWLIMLHETFMTYWIEFLRTVRKNNACVILATQSLADIANSPYVNQINESCFTKIFLPNPTAREADNRKLYQSFGLNERQVEIISESVRKKHYYVNARDVGNRLIELGLGRLELAFYGAGTQPQERQRIRDLQKTHGKYWVAQYLQEKGLEKEAEEWTKIRDKEIGTL
jgi:type IV secretion system protein TrbE